MLRAFGNTPWPAILAGVPGCAFLPPFSSSADRQFADAIAEAMVWAEKVKPMKEVNRDLGDRWGDLEAAR
jgi:hypothetical protein